MPCWRGGSACWAALLGAQGFAFAEHNLLPVRRSAAFPDGLDALESVRLRSRCYPADVSPQPPVRLDDGTE